MPSAKRPNEPNEPHSLAFKALFQFRFNSLPSKMKFINLDDAPLQPFSATIREEQWKVEERRITELTLSLIQGNVPLPFLSESMDGRGSPWNIIFVISKFSSRETCPHHFLFHRFLRLALTILLF